MTKIITTHVLLRDSGVIHVIGKRTEVIDRMETAYVNGNLGADLPVLAQKERAGPWYQSKLWVGILSLSEAVVAGEHTVEASDDPYGEEDEMAPPTRDYPGLEATL